MQHSSLMLFCEECGLANSLSATHCSACQHHLAHGTGLPGTSEIVPVTVAPPPVREVTPDQPSTEERQGVASNIQAGTILAERYLIKEEIGRGGFSIVYRAIEVNDQHRQVAIKRIPLSTLTPGQVIDATETFNREISMLTQFSGVRGVPGYYGCLTDQENWYLIMEYIAGETLEEALQKARGGYFDEKKTIRIGVELAQILNELHTNQPPVIFRDVKPANIMITPEQELFLIDFGIARTFKWGKTRDTTPLGSPGYAPREQYGQAQTDRRADIYGLGATLQTLITGRDPLELAAGEQTRNPRPPAPELQALLDKMLSPESAQRPVDMLNVQIRLKNMQPVQTRQKPPYRKLLGALLLSLTFFFLTSWTSLWLGIALSLNLWIGLGLYGNWTARLPVVGQAVVFIGREIVKCSWIALIALWIILLLLPSWIRLP